MSKFFRSLLQAGLKAKLLVIVVFAVMAFASWGASTVYGWKVSARDNALRVDSLIAQRDTTRLVFSDSLNTFERRTIQAELRIDELDRALNVRSRARATVTLSVAALDTVAASPVTSDTLGAREATLSFYRVPYTFAAQVSIPRGVASARWRVQIGLDPIPLYVRLSCATDSDLDIVPAFVQVTGPTWADIGLAELQQEPGICNPQRLQLPDAGSFFTQFSKPLAIGGGAVIVLKLLGMF